MIAAIELTNLVQWEFDLIVAAISILAGFIGALVGLGGGMIITPMLVIFLGIDIRYAMGAALASVIATSSGAGAAYLRDGISNMRIGLFLCVATTLGAIAGAWLATLLNPGALSLIFGVVLLLSVLLGLRGKGDVDTSDAPLDPLAVRFSLNASYPDADKTVSYRVQHVKSGSGMMVVAGILSGLLGIGSGAFKVLAMDQIMRIPFKVSTATSNFMIGVTAAASVGIYLGRGYLDPVLVWPVALGVLGGAFLGAKVLPLISTRWLKLIFLVAITVIGVQMIAKGMGVNL
jgi:uncharacterized membrane protein YfcA